VRRLESATLPPDSETRSVETPGGGVSAHLRWRWRFASGVAVLPFLLLGIIASVLANRVGFIVWALVGATGAVLLLRQRWPEAAPALLWAAITMAPLAWLLAREQQPLDRGYRAALWALYDVRLAQPASALLLGMLLAVAAIASAIRARRRRAHSVESQ
jgi:hypothetical protein